MAGPARAEAPELPSTSRQGGQGIYQLEGAGGFGRGSLGVSLAEELSGGADVAGGTDGRLVGRTRLGLAWDPARCLQVVLGGDLVTGGQRGGVSALIRGHLHVGERWAVGASLGGAAAGRQAPLARLALLTTFSPTELLQVSANLAAINGGTRQLLAADIYGGRQLVWGLGAQRRARMARGLQAAAFVEGSGSVALAAGAYATPARLTTGVRGVVGERARLELMLAAGARIGPLGRVGEGATDVPTWQVFAQLALHYGGDGTAPASSRPARAAEPILMTARNACTWAADCAANHACDGGQCRPVPQGESVQRRPVPPTTYVVSGAVRDAQTHAPVAGARVEVSGYPEVRLAVEGRTGAFRTWRLPVETPVELTARANGYLPARVRVRDFEGRAQVNLVLQMRPDPQARPVTVRGLMRDRTWGIPVRGTAKVDGERARVSADATGSFELTLPPGPFDILFTAPGYAAQSRHYRGAAGEVVIFNIDMEPFGSHRRLP